MWSDSWINLADDLRPFGPTTKQEHDLLVADLLSSETKEWDVARINESLPELTHLILRIKPSVLEVEDAYIWPLQKSGNYSTKSGYYAGSQATHASSIAATATATVNWKKLIWTPRLSPKLKLFLWRVLHNALPTGENLQRRGLLANTLCVRCGEIETANHLFFHCNF